MAEASSDDQRRGGWTITELLVVIVVVGILLALLLPAVQQSRESARRTFCVSNLRQLGMAMHAYHDTHGFLPPANSNSYSAHVLLLPFLEQQNLYAQIDMSRDIRDRRNEALGATPLAILECPSDSGFRTGGGSTCYVVNGGSGLHVNGEFKGMFTIPYSGDDQGGGWVSITSVTDGLSNTAAISELLVANGTTDSRRIVGRVTPVIRGANNANQFVEACDAPAILQRTVKKYSRGYPWLDGNHRSTIYNHVAPPNHRACTNSGSVPDGSYPAASFHTDGVNVCLGDGSTRFFASAIDVLIWRGFGTRSGNDVSF